jgi:integrase
MANFYYHLDNTYRDDVNLKMVNTVIRPLIKQGKSIKDYLNKKETSIYLAVTLRGKYYKFRTDYKICPIYWDLERRVIKQTFHNSMVMNDGLVLLKQRVEAKYRAIINEKPDITLSEVVDIIKAVVNGSQPSADPKSFFEAYDEFVSEKRKTVKHFTIKRLITQKNLLIEFEKKFYPIKFYSINAAFELDLKYFYSHHKQHLNNTIAKNVALLKTFMNWCIERQIHSYHDYKKFSAKEDVCEIIYLREEELMSLFNLNLEIKPYLDRVRDRWLLAAFTGQRHSDIRNFKHEDIQFVNGGYEWWLFQVKGNKAKKVVVPLSNNAMTIIRKYRKTHARQTILPPLSDTNANRYIKEACALAGIKEPITIVKYSGKKRIEIAKPKYNFISMHNARKTFVTLSLEKGLSPEFIMEITGHEDYDTMRKYLAISQKAVKNEFNRIWNDGKPNDGGDPAMTTLKVV